MKKTISIVSLSILLLLSAVFGLNQMSQLKDETEKYDQANEDYNQSIEDYEKLEEAFSLIQEKTEKLEKDLRSVNEALGDSNELLTDIDDKLNADGNIIPSIEALLEDNDKWRNELNDMTIKVNELEAQLTETEIEEEAEPVIEEGNNDEANRVKWVSDIESILSYVSNRITELEEASSSLPMLSLERIMINQEVVFLNNTKASIEALQDDISNAQ